MVGTADQGASDTGAPRGIHKQLTPDLLVLRSIAANGPRGYQWAGVWATLHFKWIQMQYPVACLAFEKLLLGGCLPIAAMMQTWGLVAATGADSAPFYQALILGGLYYLFALPLPSSFQAIPPHSRSGAPLPTRLTPGIPAFWWRQRWRTLVNRPGLVRPIFAPFAAGTSTTASTSAS